jgi:photosystem II stability/assembly factor-like uncharacterized protein
MKFRVVLLSFLFVILIFSSCRKAIPIDSSLNDTLSSVNSKWVKVLNKQAYDIYFADSLNGLALCQDGVYKTINGGETWGKLNYGTITGFNLAMGSPSTFCVTSGEIAYVSKDGGNTIKEYKGDFFYDCYFFDENTVILNGKKFLWQPGISQDGVNTLLPIFRNDTSETMNSLSPYKTITKLNDSRFWVARASGNLYETKDKGSNWSKLDLKYNKLTSIQMLSDNLGFYADQSGLKRTINGGLTWQFLNFRPIDLWFFNENVGYVSVEDGSVYFTKDGGVNWTQVFYLRNLRIVEMFFFNENNGWLSTSQGIYKYVGP